MKFDLNKCERNADGHWICQTRDGKPAKVVYVIKNRVFGLMSILDRDGQEEFASHTTDGRRHGSEFENPTDLINPPRKVKRWVNVYPDRTSGYASVTWNTKEEADANASDERIACVPIEWEEQ